jgi:hypothetical protein
MTTAHAHLATWFKTEFARRTKLLEAGDGRIDWIDAGTRVSFSEVSAKAGELGLPDDVVALRLWASKALGHR